MLPIMGSICHCSSFVFCVHTYSLWVSMNNKISCSHLLSSLTVHCSYRLKFFVVSQLGITCGMAALFHNLASFHSRLLKVKVHRGCGTAYHNAEIESRVRGGPALFITKLMMTYAAFPRYSTRPILPTVRAWTREWAQEGYKYTQVYAWELVVSWIWQWGDWSSHSRQTLC